MKILIVEDETAAYENLVAILTEIDPTIEIAGNTESIQQTIGWLERNSLPDLILMDIHLSDGSAFHIFERIQLETPVIFTTAYDEYAIEAFKVNSVDYLLKPIKVEDLARAIEKFKKLSRNDVVHYLSQLALLKPPVKYTDKILIPDRDKLIPAGTQEIACFYSTAKVTRIFLKDKRSFVYCRTLEQIATSLDPDEFIRANKQFILSRNSVRNITVWFDSRLLITLDVETPERIFVSKNKASEFKEWMVRERTV
jgi:DNA-binding LytR/AlgR family response regulator